MKNYFAYGSSANVQSFKKALSKVGLEDKISILGVGRIDGYKLAFTRLRRDNTGALDMVASSGDYVLGVVYEVPDEAMTTIDKREGHPNSYVKTGINVTLGEEEIHVLTYLVVDKKTIEICPSDDNFKKVLSGLQERFPREYVNKYYIDHVNVHFNKNYKLL